MRSSVHSLLAPESDLLGADLLGGDPFGAPDTDNAISTTSGATIVVPAGSTSAAPIASTSGSVITTTTTTSGAAAITSTGVAKSPVLTTAKQSVSVSSLFNFAGLSSDPTYLIVSALDRVEYTKGYSTGAMGYLADGSQSVGFTDFSGDAWSTSAVFTYNATTGQYVNATLGNLSQLVFDTGTDSGDTVTFELFGTNNASYATAYASNPYVMISNPSYFTYEGSDAVVTGATAITPPSTATPDSIVSAATSYVGSVWNENGCWVLASDIAAKAGATLPASSPLVGVSGLSNGEWFVAYNGLTASNANWENSLTAGEIVSFVTTSGGGHITTVVSGQGSTAELIDNITEVNAQGVVTDSANDGVTSDIIVQAPHAAMQEFSGVNPADVVVYQLDTPVVTTTIGSLSLYAGATAALGADFSASNPESGQTVTQYQVYETSAADALMVSGVAVTTALSAASSCTLSSLAGLGLSAQTAGSDTIEVRAFNGSYWGDWTSLSVSIASSTPSRVNVAGALASGTTGKLILTDTAANIGAAADALQALAAAGRLSSVTLSDSPNLVPLQVGQLSSDASLLALLPSSQALSVTGATAAQAAALQTNAQVASYSITDSGSAVASNLATLQADAACGKLAAITLSNPSTSMTLTAAQFSADGAALGKIVSSYSVNVTASTAAAAATIAANAHVASVAVSDSAANVAANLAGLQSVAAAGRLGAVIFTDTTKPTLTLSAAQVTADGAALGKIQSAYYLSISASTAAQAVALVGTTAMSSVTVTDIAANVVANLAGLQSLAAASHLGTITLSDSTKPTLTLTDAQLTLDATAIGKIGSAYNLSVTAATAAQAASLASNAHLTSVAVSDTAANVVAGLAGLQSLAAAGKLGAVTLTDTSKPSLTLTQTQLTADAMALAKITSPCSLIVTGVSVAQAAALQSNAQVASYSITDTAANVSASLATLLADANGGKLGSITISVPSAVIAMTAAQFTADAAVLAKISAGYNLSVSGSTAAMVATFAANAHVSSVTVSDTAANVVANLAALQTLAAASRLGAVTLTDSSKPSLTLTAAQFVADTAALAKITSPYSLTITGATAAQAAALQASNLVAGFAITDTAADITGQTALGADSKLTAITITGTSGANTLNLTGIKAPVAINLGGDTATVSGGLGSSTLSFLSAPDAITLGSGAAVITAGLSGSSGIETIANFQLGLDELLLNLGTATAVSAFDTTYNGTHAIALTGTGQTQGVVLVGEPSNITAASLLASHVHVSGGIATVT